MSDGNTKTVQQARHALAAIIMKTARTLQTASSEEFVASSNASSRAVDDLIAAARAEGQAEERSACASACDDEADVSDDAAEAHGARCCARRIRARGDAEAESQTDVERLRAEFAALKDEASGLREWPTFLGAKMTTAARNVLSARGVNTVAELLAITPDALLRMPGVGPKFREQIRAAQTHCAERSDPTGGILGSGSDS